MRVIFTILLICNFGTIFSQKNCNEHEEGYIPKNLLDAITYLDCEWSEKDKTEFKKKEERDAVAELHFGTGTAIRNNWELWKGKNRISRFFKSKGICHPDDMSSIILTSFHRKLNGKPIDFDGQISYYKAYWKGVKNLNKNLKQKFKKLEVGSIVKVPLYGRYDRTDKTTLIIYSYVLEDSTDFDCVVEGTVVSKHIKRKNYFVTIKLTNINGCEYKNPIYNEKEVSVGETLEINMSIGKVIII